MLFKLLAVCFLFSVSVMILSATLGGCLLLVAIYLLTYPRFAIFANRLGSVGEYCLLTALIAATASVLIAILAVLIGGGTNAL